MKNNLMKKLMPYTFIFPALLLLILFSIIPIIVSLVISFTNLDITGLGNWGAIKFIGLNNFINLFNDSLFLQAVGNTLFYVVIGVPAVIALSLAIAIMINFGQNRFFKLMRLVFYTPSITNTVAVAVVWTFMYNPSTGLINNILNQVGLADRSKCG